jgi:phosphatidate cytidylyltransferase
MQFNSTKTEQGVMGNNLVLRVLTASVLIPIVLYCTYRGGGWFDSLLLVLYLGLVYELCECRHRSFWKVLGASYLLFLLISIYSFQNDLFFLNTSIVHTVFYYLGFVLPAWLHLGILFVIFFLILRPVFKSKPFFEIATLTYVIVSLLSYRNVCETKGSMCLFLIFSLIWLGDTFAYITGKLIGGPKLAPSISPNKTWAGFLGGSIIPVVLSPYIASLLKTSIPMWVALIIVVSGHIGDLFESFVKRKLDIKDSGHIIPGHGGIFDRLDSLLFVGIILLCIEIYL